MLNVTFKDAVDGSLSFEAPGRRAAGRRRLGDRALQQFMHIPADVFDVLTSRWSISAPPAGPQRPGDLVSTALQMLQLPPLWWSLAHQHLRLLAAACWTFLPGGENPEKIRICRRNFRSNVLSATQRVERTFQLL